MFFQRILAWALLAAGGAWVMHGIYSARWWSQAYWSSEGAWRMGAFVGIYAAVAGLLAWFAPRWFVPALAVAVTGYSLVAAGPLAVLSVLLVVGVSYVTGAYWMRRRPRALREMPVGLTVLGLGAWMVFVAVMARFPMHYWPVYLVLFAAMGFWAWTRQVPRLPEVAWPADRAGVMYLAIPALPLLAHWLAALKPEVGAKALSVHLVAPARMAVHHVWNFDVLEFAWAVKPMGGEWVFTLGYLFGGEAGARLLNVAILTLLCWLLYGWLHDLLPNRFASLLTAGFASLPLAHGMTGSLRVENVAALLLLGALYFFRRHLKTRIAGYGYAAAFLAGGAAMVSTGAAGFALALGVAACMTVPWRTLLKAAPLALGVGLMPYLEAGIRTGNPVFPYFNDYFRSQLFDATKRLDDTGGLAMAGLGIWGDLTFHTSRFVAGLDGGFGFLYLLLGPVCLAAIRPNWPRIGLVLLGVWWAGLVAVGVVGGRGEHLYVGLPVLTLLIGVMTATFRAHSPALLKVILGLLAVGFGLQMAMLPAVAPQHRDFALNQVFRPESVDEYLARYAPERPLVRELNRIAPLGRVAWLETNTVAGFAGRVFTNSWHHDAFQKRIEALTTTEGLLFAATELELGYFIAPAPDSALQLTSVFTREFLDLYTEPQYRFADRELRKFKPPQGGLAPLQLAYAPPGEHDELNSFVRYEGPWRRDLRAGEAWKGTLTYSNDLRARVFIRFQGRAITPLYTAAANRCTGVMSLDEAEEVELAQYAEATRWQARGPRMEAAPGYHTLVIRLPQARSTTTSVAACFLDLDGFIVE
ncbi:MAG TPA: hypothetical protein PLF84_13355 [Bryobacteraceae bacterium]|nr:hypothetical protein [Bryobacteraceae bacterium]